MSDPKQQPQQQQQQTANTAVAKNPNDKAKEEQEQEDEGYTCGKCCRGYESCIVWTCKVSNYKLYYTYYIYITPVYLQNYRWNKRLH